MMLCIVCVLDHGRKVPLGVIFKIKKNTQALITIESYGWRFTLAFLIYDLTVFGLVARAKRIGY